MMPRDSPDSEIGGSDGGRQPHCAFGQRAINERACRSDAIAGHRDQLPFDLVKLCMRPEWQQWRRVEWL